MKKADKGFIKAVKKDKPIITKSLCGRNDCYKQTKWEDKEEITECVTCGKILNIK